MYEEEIEKLNTKRWLFISASGFSVVTDPRTLDRDVAVHLHIPDNQLGMAPGVGLALRMSPTEARRFAEVLHRRADEAEVGLPRA